ncbi:MAG: hypothetical protein IT381_26510 [Deltaproteobacteria bacterium]|nr:hypothetical protein [Deltaproteobacteria bacterium]
MRSFQQKEGIAATGMPDQLTLRKLDFDPQEILRKNPRDERKNDAHANDASDTKSDR